MAKLNQIAVVTSGNSAPQKTELFENGSYPFVRTGDVGRVHRSTFFTQPEDYLNDIGIKGMRLFPKGSILIPKSGASTLLNHRVILGEDSYVVSHLAVVIPRDNVATSEYIYYAMSHIDVGELVDDRAYPSLKTSTIGAIDIPLPSLDEQERIVAELNLLTGIIDKQKQQLKELDILAQSIFYDMFNDTESAKVVSLSDVCSVVKGLVNPNDEPYCNYPHIGGANIESNTGKFVDVKIAKEENLISGKYPFDETMILYSKIRPNLNKVALPTFSGICSADMYPLIPKANINRVFLKYILTQKEFLSYAIAHSGRANIPKINREDLLGYTFPLFNINLQESFAQKIQSIESQKELITRSITETQKLFDYTMDKYFG